MSTIVCIVFIICLSVVLLAVMDSIDKVLQRKYDNKSKKEDENESEVQGE